MLTTGYKNWSRQWLLEGMEKGAAAILLRQLERKFGALSADAVTRVEQATHAQVELWSLNLLDAETLDEVFASGNGAPTGEPSA